MSAVQRRTFHCRDCGETVPVTRVTPFEFTYRCRCASHRLSWAHWAPPPMFEAEPAPEPRPEPLLWDV